MQQATTYGILFISSKLTRLKGPLEIPSYQCCDGIVSPRKLFANGPTYVQITLSWREHQLKNHLSQHAVFLLSVATSSMQNAKGLLCSLKRVSKRKEDTVLIFENG